VLWQTCDYARRAGPRDRYTREEIFDFDAEAFHIAFVSTRRNITTMRFKEGACYDVVWVAFGSCLRALR